VDIARVTCDGCGAALEVGERARFATCKYCGAKLEIKHTESAVFTEVLERIDKNTAGMAEDLDAIRREQEIARLDREWQLERAGFLQRDKHGNLHEPSTTGGMVGAFIGGGFGLLWTIMAIAMTGSAPAEGPFVVAKVIFPLFGILFTIGAVVAGIKGASAAGQFEQAQSAYQRKRAALVAEGKAVAAAATGTETAGSVEQ
jgi:hypothetical protein